MTHFGKSRSSPTVSLYVFYSEYYLYAVLYTPCWTYDGYYVLTHRWTPPTTSVWSPHFATNLNLENLQNNIYTQHLISRVPTFWLICYVCSLLEHRPSYYILTSLIRNRRHKRMTCLCYLYTIWYRIFVVKLYLVINNPQLWWWCDILRAQNVVFVVNNLLLVVVI